MKKIKVVLGEHAYMPVKAHDADAGYDIFTPIEFEIERGQEIFIDTGVSMLIPKGTVGMIKSKSGLNKKYSITTEGVIDAGYTGTIGVKMYMHISSKEVKKTFKRGDKITQLVLVDIPEFEFVHADKLEHTERGDGGFGSTGA